MSKLNLVRAIGIALATGGMMAVAPAAQAQTAFNANQESMYSLVIKDLPPGVTVPPDISDEDLIAVLSSNAGLCPRLVRKFDPAFGGQGGTENEKRLLERCSALVFATDPNARAAALDMWTAEEATAASKNGVEFASTQRSGIESRLTALRTGMSAAGRVASLAPGITGFEYATGGASGDDAMGGKLGFFLNGYTGSGEKDETELEAAFDFDVVGLTAGFDYQFSDSFVAGVALGFGSSESDFKNGSKIDTDNLSGAVFATVYGDRAYADFIGTYGSLDHDTRRAVRYQLQWAQVTEVGNPVASESINHTASGSTDGSSVALGASAGYNFGSDAWSLTPYAAINYLDIDIDGYRESGGNNPEMNLLYGDQSAKSLQLSVGLTVGYVASTSFGVVSPYGRVAYVSEQEDGGERFLIKFVADSFDTSDTDAFVRSDKLDDSFFRWALGLSATFANGLAGFVEYESLQSYDAVDYGEFALGLRYEFR